MVLAFAVPVPLHTRAEGVSGLPDQAIVRAGGIGSSPRWLVEPGTQVKRGGHCLPLEDPLLATELEVARARVAEAEAVTL